VRLATQTAEEMAAEETTEDGEGTLAEQHAGGAPPEPYAESLCSFRFRASLAATYLVILLVFLPAVSCLVCLALPLIFARLDSLLSPTPQSRPAVEKLNLSALKPLAPIATESGSILISRNKKQKYSKVRHTHSSFFGFALRYCPLASTPHAELSPLLFSAGN
jgi:hypothetical protein